MHKGLRRTLVALLCLAALMAVIAPSAFARATPKADTIYINGNIYTVDTHFNKVQAMAIKNGKFIAVGNDAKVMRYFGKKTTIINLKGKTVFPGLWDSHLHFTSTGQALMRLDATGLQPADIIAKVVAAVATAKPGDWIIGQGWNQVLWTDQSGLVGGMPTAAMLDAVSPNNPVYLSRVDGHGLWVNSMAMQLNNVDKNTADVQGGKIYRYPDGTPTGAFADAANSLIKTPSMSEDQLKQAELLAQQKFFSMGNTSVAAMSVSAAEAERLRGLYTAGSLKMRINAYINVADAPTYYAQPKSQRVGLFGDHYTINGIKLVSDGALGSRGAWLMAPYSDAVAAGLPATWVGYPTFGAPYTDANGNPVQVPTMQQVTDKLVAVMEPATKAGFQVAIHAIGDAANHTYLDAVQKVEQDLPKLTKDPRFRDEHTQIVALSDLPRFAPLKVVPSMQAQHATSDMNMAEARIGYPRILGGYAWQTLIKEGCKIPDGSDSPVELANPFWGLYSAVTREDHNGQSPVGAHTPGGAHPWYGAQCMTRRQALESFTTWAAYGAFAERNRGSIIKGMEADFVVIGYPSAKEHDYLKMPAADIWKLNANMTVVGGQAVYTAPGFDILH
jgi:predicted amidohydrolase YtcJ